MRNAVNGGEDEYVDARRTTQVDSPTWTDVVAPDDDDGDDEWGAITVVDSGWKGNGGRCRLGTVFQLTRPGHIDVAKNTPPENHPITLCQS